ncbi:hypothetical protein G9A89_015855 [Geosiphon pyriformis]|nr:hypothetical protein G9A89_015855 [Geosiphon pyriformis]
MNISYDEKLKCEIGKDMSYGAGSKSNEQLDSCTNTPKAKCFDSGIMNTSSLGLCDFGSAVNNFDMSLSPLVFLKFSYCSVVSVKEKFCFEPTKSFTLDINLLAVPGIQLIGLWQKVLVEFESSQVTDLVVSKWSILLGKDLVCVAKANTDKQTWDLKDSYCTLLYTLPIGITAHDLSDLVQSYGGKTCYISRNSAPVSYPVSFSGATWSSVISGFPKNSYSTLLVENNLSIGSVDSLMPVVTILALHISVLEHSHENMSDQVTDISYKLDRLLAVSSVNFAVPLSPEHNPMLDMVVDAPLFVPSVPSVVTTVSQEIFLSGAHVLTAKVGGLKANLTVLKNLVKAILNKLDSFCSGSSMITPFFPQ